jgi:hypothetical protein
MRLPLIAAQIIALCLGSIALDSRAAPLSSRTTPVAVGEMAPDFLLEDHQRHKNTLSEARGKSPVVLVFYRGYW